MTISSEKLAEQLASLVPVLAAVAAWLLLAIGATYAAVGFGLVWLAHRVRPHAGVLGGATAAVIGFSAWLTLVPAGLCIAGGFGLRRLRV